MIRRSISAAVLLCAVWAAMIYAVAVYENEHPIGGAIAPINFGALVVLGVGLSCAAAAYAFFSARGAFGSRVKFENAVEEGERVACDPGDAIAA